MLISGTFFLSDIADAVGHAACINQDALFDGLSRYFMFGEEDIATLFRENEAGVVLVGGSEVKISIFRGGPLFTIKRQTPTKEGTVPTAFLVVKDAGVRAYPVSVALHALSLYSPSTVVEVDGKKMNVRAASILYDTMLETTS
ncbi:MAG: hypothetical protein QXZ09_07100 [Candidatus Methanomethylicaceae archaeon]